MSDLERFGVSMDGKLLREFDRLARRRGYTNRSELIRDLARAELVKDEWDSTDKEVVGVLSFVYDHTVMEAADRVLETEHREFSEIVSSLHVHLDRKHCLEVLVMKGGPKHIREVASKILSLRGVKHGQLVETTTAKEV